MLVKAAGLAIDLCLCFDILSYRVPSVSTRGVDIMQWPLAAELPMPSFTHGATSKIANIHPGWSPASLTVYHSNQNWGDTAEGRVTSHVAPARVHG